MTEPMPYRRRPCGPSSEGSGCPFRTDTDPDDFPEDRWRELAKTAGRPGGEIPLGSPMFGCHGGIRGGDAACAGWLAVCGYDHLGVRMAVVTGRLPAEALTPGDGWPDLYESWDALMAAKLGE